jgi:hypothetical protein
MVASLGGVISSAERAEIAEKNTRIEINIILIITDLGWVIFFFSRNKQGLIVQPILADGFWEDKG